MPNFFPSFPKGRIYGLFIVALLAVLAIFLLWQPRGDHAPADDSKKITASYLPTDAAPTALPQAQQNAASEWIEVTP